MLAAIVYARMLEEVYVAGPANEIELRVAAEEAARTARWRAYHFGGGTQRVQLPWELILNDIIDRSRTRKLDRIGDKEIKIDEPPRSAITLLHPTIGVNLKTKEGADVALAGVVELLGYSRWSYGEDNSRSGEWGASIVAAYQPSNTADDWGYGALLRTPWNNVNIAWIRTEQDDGSDDDAFLVSVDIPQLVSGLMGSSNGGACRGGVGACAGG
jgi:hypothetical protein